MPLDAASRSACSRPIRRRLNADCFPCARNNFGPTPGKPKKSPQPGPPFRARCPTGSFLLDVSPPIILSRLSFTCARSFRLSSENIVQCNGRCPERALFETRGGDLGGSYFRLLAMRLPKLQSLVLVLAGCLLLADPLRAASFSTVVIDAPSVHEALRR